jgi:hypothetical protein
MEHNTTHRRTNMADIIASIPWHCGESDCPAQWHLEHYWAHDDGTYTSCDADGDHESVEPSELPTPEEERDAWHAYHEHVAQTGDDPIGQFTLPTSVGTKRRWQMRVVASIQGLKVVGVRRRGRGPWIDPQKAPQEVRGYLMIDRRNVIDADASGYRTLDQLAAALDEKTVKRRGWLALLHTFEVEERRTWSEEHVRRYLAKRARQALRA